MLGKGDHLLERAVEKVKLNCLGIPVSNNILLLHVFYLLMINSKNCKNLFFGEHTEKFKIFKLLKHFWYYALLSTSTSICVPTMLNQ